MDLPGHRLASPKRDGRFDLEVALQRLAAGEHDLRAPGDTPLEQAFNQVAERLGPFQSAFSLVATPLVGGVSADGYVAAMSIQGLSRLRRQLGPNVADHIVQETTDRLRALLPRTRIGRVGRASLEFALDAQDDAEAEAVLVKLQADLERRLFIDGQIFDLEMVIGFASRALHDEHVADCAADALIEAQAHGRSVQLYREADALKAAESSALLRDLRAAVAENALSLVYQPKLHLPSQQVRSVEALLRWRHPSKGWISPDTFIGLAEETGLIADLTQWVVGQALADQARLATAGQSITVYLNLSGRLLADASFCAWILSTIGRSEAGGLGFEITETAVIDDPERALANLKALADAGVKIAIDDYGSGLSSLSYLKEMPAHELKIDRMFISNLTSSHRDPLLVRSTIDVAHALGMEVTAEGVENAGTLALLRVMGCDSVQGFLVAKPLTLAALETLLSDEDFAALLNRRGAPFRLSGAAASGATG